jgi:hypothetical protein
MLDASRALAVAQRVAQRLPTGGLFAGATWRTASEPLALPSSLARDLEKLGYRLYKFLRACDLLYVQSVRGTAPRWIAQLLDAGKPADVVELGRDRAFRGEIPGVIRPDILPTPEGYILSEIDSTPGGIGLTSWLNRTYSEEGCHVLGGAGGMSEGFASLFPGGADIVVSEEAASYRPEMEWLAADLQRRELGDFPVRGQNDPGSWERSVYRFFEMFDLPQIPCAPQIWESARTQRIRVSAPPKAYLEEKLWFALFWLKPLEGFWRRELGSGVWSALRRHLPRTWLLDPTPLPPQAVYPGLEINDWAELSGFSQRQRHLVIKLSGFNERAWGARSVVIGHDVPGEEWARAVESALAAYPGCPHILQEFHAATVLPTRMLSSDGDSLEETLVRPRLCPYYFVQGKEIRLGGVLATLCPADKKILHGMSDAILCPVSAAWQPDQE